VIVAKKDSKLTVDQMLAKDNKLGVQRGTTEAKWIEENLIKKAGKKFTLVQYDSAPLAVDDVINRRIVGTFGRFLPRQPARDRGSSCHHRHRLPHPHFHSRLPAPATGAPSPPPRV